MLFSSSGCGNAYPSLFVASRIPTHDSDNPWSIRRRHGFGSFEFCHSVCGLRGCQLSVLPVARRIQAVSYLFRFWFFHCPDFFLFLQQGMKESLHFCVRLTSWCIIPSTLTVGCCDSERRIDPLQRATFHSTETTTASRTAVDKPWWTLGCCAKGQPHSTDPRNWRCQTLAVKSNDTRNCVVSTALISDCDICYNCHNLLHVRLY